MSETTTHLRMGRLQLLISVTTGTYKMTLTGRALVQHQNLVSNAVSTFQK